MLCIFNCYIAYIYEELDLKIQYISKKEGKVEDLLSLRRLHFVT